MALRFFLAGIMQGSHHGQDLHDQSYRSRIKQLLFEHFNDADVYDPLADHADSVGYGEEQGRQVFYKHNRMCGDVDVVIAYVPQASMGTAIEMWEAWRHEKVVITISPMSHNWVIRFCSHVIYPDAATFERAVASGEVAAKITEARK